MRTNLAFLAGFDEFNKIKEYAWQELSPEERQFLEKVKEVIEDYEWETSNEFMSLDDITKLIGIWRKYEHLKPFLFHFDPEKKIPEVFHNQTAFIIWTAWKSRHLVCQDDDIKGGSLAVANVLLEHKPPFSKEVKREAVEEFLKYLHSSYPDAETELDFWEQRIFPYLEGKWKFKWELKEED